MKQVVILITSFALGALARDLIVTRAGAEEDALRRTDVERIVRALEGQAKASADLVRATQDVGREVRDAGRNCNR